MKTKKVVIVLAEEDYETIKQAGKRLQITPRQFFLQAAEELLNAEIQYLTEHDPDHGNIEPEGFEFKVERIAKRSFSHIRPPSKDVSF